MLLTVPTTSYHVLILYLVQNASFSSPLTFWSEKVQKQRYLFCVAIPCVLNHCSFIQSSSQKGSYLSSSQWKELSWHLYCIQHTILTKHIGNCSFETTVPLSNIADFIQWTQNYWVKGRSRKRSGRTRVKGIYGSIHKGNGQEFA